MAYFSSCYCVIVFCSLAQKVHILLEPTRLKWLHLLPDIIMAMKLLFHVRMGIKVCFCRPFSHELHSQNSYRIFEVRNLFQAFSEVIYFSYIAAELQDIGPQERRIARKTESNCDRTPRSCQVMMLESYVLQLLCVQKVLMDSSEQDTTKKV